MPPVLDIKEPGQDFSDAYMMVARATQFEIQEDVATKIYRYSYYFSFKNDAIDMEDEFKTKFGCSYSDFLSIILGWWYWLSISKRPVPQHAFEKMMTAHPKVIESLSITRDRYAEELSSITLDQDDYLYCLRPSYSYPFIRDGDMLYLPLPHLLIRSVTSSLMFRLTDNNLALREKIGKEVLENYLFGILSDAEEFDELLCEQEYSVSGVTQKTIDVMGRKGDITVFFDSKSFTPKSQIRVFSQEAIENDIRRIAKCCRQMYHHIHDEFQHNYDFFVAREEIPMGNRYGLVVLAEEPYFRLDVIFNVAAEMLGIEIGSYEYNWMRDHIGIVETYEIERMCFTRSSIVNRILDRKNGHSQNDVWLAGSTDSKKIKDLSFSSFQHKIKQIGVDSLKAYVD